MLVNQLNRPIFILGAHKSGSSLIRSLLDGHPELFTTPIEMHFFRMAGYWVDYHFGKSRPPILPLERTKERWINLVKEYNSTAYRFGDANVVGRFDIHQLEQELNSDVASFRELMVRYVHGIYAALFGAEMPNGLRVVEKSVEHAEFAMDLKSMFSDAKFIHILRNPYANLVSLRRFTSKTDYPFLGPSLSVLYNSFYYLYRNQRLLNDYMVIRYEDLLTDTESMMKAVANFLEIEFTDNLLRPTCLGELWPGNSSRGIEYSGISVTNLDRWRGEITDLEIYYVTKYFGFLLNEYGYRVMTPRRSFFWPVRGERLKTYLKNRFIRYCM